MELRTGMVEPQTSPLVLELLGTTAHDPDSLVKVRPRFDSLVSKVHATLGGDRSGGLPLIDLYSAQLAEAKSVYEEKLRNGTTTAVNGIAIRSSSSRR